MKCLLLFLCTLACILVGYAQNEEKKYAEIKFEKTVHNFGKFSEESPKVSCKFIYTNTGNIPLIINQAMTSCGCTVSTYTKEPVLPGKQGEVSVVYNGKGKFPGHFRKSITITSNAKNPLVRIYIEGDMVEKNKK